MHSPLNTDNQLLKALAAGDREVTGELYRRNYPIVKGWIVKSGGSEADCADIFQEALVVLFSKVQDEEFTLTSSIGRNPSILWEDTNTLEDLHTGHDDDIKIHHEREVHYQQLNLALDQIGEPCRSLLMAYYHEDKNMQEISASFGYTNAENAKNQKYKCLNRLKKLFFSQKAE